MSFYLRNLFENHQQTSGREMADGPTLVLDEAPETAGVGVEEVVLPLLFFAHTGLDTSLAGTSKADLKRSWLLHCSVALSFQGRRKNLFFKLFFVSTSRKKS